MPVCVRGGRVHRRAAKVWGTTLYAGTATGTTVGKRREGSHPRKYSCTWSQWNAFWQEETLTLWNVSRLHETPYWNLSWTVVFFNEHFFPISNLGVSAGRGETFWVEAFRCDLCNYPKCLFKHELSKNRVNLKSAELEKRGEWETVCLHSLGPLLNRG